MGYRVLLRFEAFHGKKYICFGFSAPRHGKTRLSAKEKGPESSQVWKTESHLNKSRRAEIDDRTESESDARLCGCRRAYLMLQISAEARPERPVRSASSIPRVEREKSAQ